MRARTYFTDHDDGKQPTGSTEFESVASVLRRLVFPALLERAAHSSPSCDDIHDYVEPTETEVLA